ncbi:MAG TPA: hypothetical protein VM802_14420 [Chitinophaga sp.]|uniref:hypothetical protein n=1 Tax=Chitinophaga sp. TaxID=1869181 RepID=UPI002BAEFFB3|nr:hypothetical protein [Chitinophaga sp.]HVI46067.1 hypothetical protein [Chitinophaga sp.]
MIAYNSLLLVAALSVTLFSCSREISVAPDRNPDGNPDSRIYGSYDYISMSAATKNTSSGVVNGSEHTTVSVSNYTTTDNAGVLTIAPGIVTFSGFSYSIDAEVLKYSYTNGIADGNKVEIPWKFSLPASSSEAPARLIGADSIYFEKGITVLATTSGIESQASGAKYTLEGDILILTGKMAKTTTLEQGDITTIKSELVYVIKYKKRKR